MLKQHTAFRKTQNALSFTIPFTLIPLSLEIVSQGSQAVNLSSSLVPSDYWLERFGLTWF